jgi:tetratricopeptide (TPR) repeat protein
VTKKSPNTGSCSRFAFLRRGSRTMPRLTCAWIATLFLVCSCAEILCAQTLSVESPPGVAESRSDYLRGLELVRQGKVDEAIVAFQQGLSQAPKDAVMLDATGAAYMLKGDTEEAKKYLLMSLRVSPALVPARKNLAMAYFSSSQYELAAAEFQKLTMVHGPTAQIASLFLGMICEKKAQYSRAVSFFSHASGLLNRYPDALLSLANAENQLKRVDKAGSALKPILQMSGLTAAQHLRASQLFSQLGDDKAALQEAESANAQDSHLAGLAYQRAQALDRAGRSEDALGLLKNVAKEEADADTLNLLSHVARENHEFALALDSLREAAKLAPEKEENYLDFSTFCADYGNYQLALEGAEVGLEHLPNSYRLQVQRAVVLENLGRLKDSEEALRKAAVLQKDNSLALVCLAIVQTHGAKLREAEATLTSGIREFPTNYYLHYQLGMVLVEVQGGLPLKPQLQARARHAFSEAIRLNPSFADSYYQLAKLYSEDSPKLAEQNLVACLRVNPNHGPAEYKLARLYQSTGRQTEAQKLLDRFESLQQSSKEEEMQQPRIESAPR